MKFPPGAMIYALLILSTACGTREADSKISDEQGQQNLRQLYFVFQEYASNYGGNLPKSIEIALKDRDTSVSTFKHNKLMKDSVDPKLEYIYVDWSSAFTFWDLKKQKYPIAYDNRIDWYSKPGIYVLLSDGSVFWDPEARWLKEFANSHPKVKLRLPAD